MPRRSRAAHTRLAHRGRSLANLGNIWITTPPVSTPLQRSPAVSLFRRYRHDRWDRPLREQEVVGSSPATPTIQNGKVERPFSVDTESERSCHCSLRTSVSEVRIHSRSCARSPVRQARSSFPVFRATRLPPTDSPPAPAPTIPAKTVRSRRPSSPTSRTIRPGEVIGGCRGLGVLW